VRTVIALAVLSGPLPKLGVIAVGALAAGVILARDQRMRAWAMVGALVLAPVLLIAEIWHSPQLEIVHRHPLEAAVGTAAVLVVLGAAAYAIWRTPWLLAPLAVLALPFRVPISAASTTSNLLVPLYFVVAAASIGWVVRSLSDDRAGARPAVAGAGGAPGGSGADWLGRLLAAWLVLYAVQAVYTSDFDKALQQMVFFYVPFALLFALLRELHWDRRLLGMCLAITAALAVIFTAIGAIEFETKTIFLNSKLVEANNVHTFFVVNSVFYDPDIFGRYLALVMILLAAVLLYDERPRLQVGVTVVLAILWGGLVLTLSRSSLAALLVGLGTLAAMRWKVWPVLATATVVAVVGGAAILVSPHTFGLNQGLNNASSGRANLITGGVHVFAQRPITGYGSASFVDAYSDRYHVIDRGLAASHTIPVTVAAEQGLIGLALYVPLVIVAVFTLVGGARSHGERAAIAAAFLALMLHTLLYADFLEDPVTWTLLGVGSALAAAQRVREHTTESARERWLRRRAERDGQAPQIGVT
jgi:O-antigen ligase